jgi:Sec-independent protein translocase protein TatA
LGNIFQKFIQRTVVKAALKKQYQKAKKLKDAARDVGQTLVNRKNTLTEQRDALKQTLKTKKQKLEEKLHAPPFLRTTDKMYIVTHNSKITY